MPYLRRMRCQAVLFVCLFPAMGQDSVRLYLPMDGQTAWLGPARREPIPFSRDSAAMAPDWTLVGEDIPRIVQGRVGQATIYEGGNYWMNHRGTSNWLKPEVALLDEPGLWTTSGAVTANAVTPALVGRNAVLVRFGQGGQEVARILSPPVTLRYLEEHHIGSVQVKLAGERARNVRLTVMDNGLNFVAQSAALEPSAEWQPVYVRFQIPKGKQPTDLRLGLTADPGSTIAIDAAMVEQAATFYHDRKSPSSWVPGLTHRAIEKTTWPIFPEMLDPAQGTIALFVEPLEEVTNSTFVAVGQGWTMPLRIYREANGRVIGTVGKTNLAFGPVEPRRWTHLTLTWDGGAAVAYRDGQKVDEKGYDPASVPDIYAMMAAGYELAIGHDELGGFSRSTGANAALDEVLIAASAYDADNIRALAETPESLAAVFSGPAVDLSGVRRAYGREEAEAQQTIVVSGSPRQVRVVLDDQPLLNADSPSDGQSLACAIQPARLSEGRHQLQIAVLGGPAPLTARMPIWIGPARHSDALPVVGWNVPPEHYAEFAAAGGTVVNSSPDPRAEVRCRIAGLGGMWSYSNKAAPPLDAPQDWYVTAPDGSRGGVWLANPEVQEHAVQKAVSDAQQTVRFPHLDLVLLNTEWGVSPNFSAAAIKLAKEATGLDLTWWPLDASILQQYSPQQIEAAEAGQGDAQPTTLRPFNLLPADKLPAAHQPVEGAIAENNPLYQYTLWWHRTQSLAPWNDRLARIFLKANPELEPVFDPMLRGPSLRSYRSMAYAQEWVYYENPLSMIPVQEALGTICRDTTMRPTVMPQFLFKAGTSAPISVTPPRDLVIESTWMGCSRPTSMVTYWGWQLVFGPGEMWTTERYDEYFKGLDWEQARAKLAEDKPKAPHLWHPGAWEAFRELDATLFKPFGKLMMEWRNAPRNVAMVKSLASEVFSTERWWTAFRYGPPAAAVTATGLPYDLLYDEDVAPERLAGYAALVLPAVTVLPRPALDAVRAFAGQGGLVLAEPDFAVHVPGAVAIERWSAETVRAALAARPLTSRLLPQQAAAAVNQLVIDNTQFVVAVNDCREAGPMLGRWGKVAEQGVAQSVTIGVPAAQAWYELTLAREVSPTGGQLRVELPAAGGRIIGCYRQQFGKLSLRPRQGAGKLGVIVETASETDEAFAGPVPVEVAITRPDGTVDDHSQTVLCRNGAWELDLPANQPGVWRIVARERLTGSTAEASVTVGSTP